VGFSTSLSLLLTLVSVAEPSPKPCAITESVSNLSPHVEVFSEGSSDESWSGEVPPPELFSRLDSDVPNLGLSPGRHWFRVNVENKLRAQTFIVEAGYPLLDYLDFFIKRDVELIGPVESGDLRPFGTRSRPHRTLNFAFHLDAAESVELYFRVETESSVQLPLTLYTEAAFGEHTSAESIGFGLFYGAIIVILLFNLFQWLMIKEAVYGLYVGFLASLLIFQMSINGSLFEWILPSSPNIANVSLLIFNFLAWGFGLLFAASFLTLESISPKFNRTVKAIAAICVFGAMASLILPYRSLVPFVVIFAVVFPAVFFAMGVIGIRAGQRSAKYFTLAFAILMVGSVLYALKTATILPANFVTSYAMQIGSVLEVVLLSLALGAQAREAFEERDRLMSEVLQKTKALSVEAEARSQVERERAQAVEDLRLEAETKIALFSDATHHLNNPLNHITGAREIIGGELTLVRERLDTILPEDDDPDVRAVRKAFRQNFDKIAESEMRLDDALSRASNAVAVLRSVSGVDGVGVEPCYVAEIWALLQERIFVAEEDSRLSPPAEFMELQVLGAPGLYVQAMEVLLEAAHHVPTITYTTHGPSLICSFEHSELPHEQLLSLVSKVNHLVKVTGAGANLDDADVVQLSIPMAETLTSGGQAL